MSDEEYVRSVWELTTRCDGSYRHYSKGTVIVQDAHGHWVDFPSWSAAAEFTRNRLEQITQVEEEIRLLQSMVILLSTERGDETAPIYKRTIARLEAALAELKQGMKDQGRV